MADSCDELDVLTNRTWLKNVHISDNGISEKSTFSIVSYNILADHHMRYLGTDVYPDLEAEVLDQGKRHEKLIKELEYLNADVVCLQECGIDYYKVTLEPAMKSLGYDGFIKKRLGDKHPEGEATFYRTSRFTVIHSSSIDLKDLADQLIGQCELDDSTKSCLQQYFASSIFEVVLLTKFRCNMTGKELTVGNVHIKFTYYKFLDVQCMEVACAVKALTKVADDSHNALILCGDFNAMPSMAPYQLARDGYLNDESIDQLQQMKTVTMHDGSKQSSVDFWCNEVRQSPGPTLESAYVAATGSNPVATSVDVTGPVPSECIDFIFFTPGTMHVLGVLECPSEAVLQKILPLPNEVFPSDHIAVKAKMAFKNESSESEES